MATPTPRAEEESVGPKGKAGPAVCSGWRGLTWVAGGGQGAEPSKRLPSGAAPWECGSLTLETGEGEQTE